MKRIPAFLVLLFVAFAAKAAADLPQRPNFIYILLDDAGYGDFSCYGQKKFKTPNIDALAKKGLKFTQHYSGSTVCAPTRCSIMEGRHTGHTFVRGNKEIKPEGQYPIPADLVTLPKLLQKNGYTTGMFGKWGLGAPGSEGDPVNQGWDEFFGYNCQRQAHTYYPTHLWHNDKKIPQKGKDYAHDVIMAEAMKFLRENKKNPFFAYMSVTIPHAAMQVPEEDAAPFREKFKEHEDKTGKYAGTQVTNPAAMFAGMMTRLDRDIGRVIDLLELMGIAENTLVMITSDNGPHKEGGHMPDFFNSNGKLKGYKRDLYEGGVRTPLIAWWPGTIKRGTTRHISAHWDVLPTLCELSGTKVPHKIDGISFAPTLLGNKREQQEHDYLYWEFHERGKKQAIRMGKWKAIRLDLAKNPNGPIELYDLNKDIGEEKNIAEKHPDIIEKIKPLFESARTESEIFTLFPGKK